MCLREKKNGDEGIVYKGLNSGLAVYLFVHVQQRRGTRRIRESSRNAKFLVKGRGGDRGGKGTKINGKESAADCRWLVVLPFFPSTFSPLLPLSLSLFLAFFSFSRVSFAVRLSFRARLLAVCVLFRRARPLLLPRSILIRARTSAQVNLAGTDAERDADADRAKDARENLPLRDPLPFFYRDSS